MMNDNSNTSAPETITLQREVIVHSTDDQWTLIGEEAVAWCPKGYKYVGVMIVGGFAVGSWWEHDKGIVISLKYERDRKLNAGEKVKPQCNCPECSTHGTMKNDRAGAALHTSTRWWYEGSTPHSVNAFLETVLDCEGHPEQWTSGIDKTFDELSDAGRLYVWNKCISRGTENLEFAKLCHKHFHRTILEVFKVTPGESGVGTKARI